MRAAKVIDNVLLADQRYTACFENFRARNKALEEFRGKLNSTAIGVSYEFDLRSAAMVVEPGRMLALHRNTEGIIEVVDETISTINDALTGIEGALDKKFEIKGGPAVKVNRTGSEFFEKIKPPFFTPDELRSYLQGNN
ncbi:hypothetical protein D3C77_468290 [compost metagenome]